jgi:Cu-Zn family superoxide dismutase
MWKFLASKSLPTALLCAIVAPAINAQRHFAPLTITLKTVTGYEVGTATFRPTIHGALSFQIKLKDIPAGEHALHIHENPVCDGGLDFKTAGGHLNPDKKQHGWLNPHGHHIGDLPQNVVVYPVPRGTNILRLGEANFTVDDLSLTPGAANSILGRALIVHDHADDMKTDPSGSSGNRIACGIIALPSSASQ